MNLEEKLKEEIYEYVLKFGLNKDELKAKQCFKWQNTTKSTKRNNITKLRGVKNCLE